jgi:hypothetical protein
LSWNIGCGLFGRVSSDNDIDPDYVNEASSAQSLLESWKRGQKYVDHFWKLWKNDYLLSLREHTDSSKQGHKAKSDPHVGDIVQVESDGPRGTWQLGKIITLKESADGEIRVAEIKLSSGRILVRSIKHLYPLECSTHCNESQVADDNQNVTTKEEENHNTTSNSDLARRPVRASAQAARRWLHDVCLDEVTD